MASARWQSLAPDADWSGRSEAEHADALERACRGAMLLLEGQPDREARLRMTDPVPASTHALLRRLAARRDG